MTAKPMVFIVGADKGGVGKTTVTRALLAYFKSHGVDFKAWDTEPAPGVLARFYPDTAICKIVDLQKSDGQMQVFDNLSKNYVSVIDCKAGLLSETLKTLSNIGFMDAMREGKLDVVVLHILGATKASFEEIQAAASVLSGAKHYLVTNHINDTVYFGWDSDEAKTTLAKATGVIDVPKLDELAMEHVGEMSATFGAFADDTSTSFVIRGLVRHWMKQVYEAFNTAKLDPQ